MSLQKLILSYLKKNYRLVGLSFGCMLVVSFFHAFLLFLLGPFLTLFFGAKSTLSGVSFMDRFTQFVLDLNPLHLAVGLPLLLVTAKLFSAFCQYYYKYTQSRLFIGFVQEIRLWLFERVVSLPTEEIQAKVPSEWTSLMMHEVDYLKGRILALVQGLSKDAAALLGCAFVVVFSLFSVIHIISIYVFLLALIFFGSGWMLSTHAHRYQKYIARMVHLAQNFSERYVYVRAEKVDKSESKALLSESEGFYLERRRILWVTTLMGPALEFSVVLMISLLCYFFWNEAVTLSSASFLSGVGAFAAALKPIRSLGQNGASLFEIYGVMQEKWGVLLAGHHNKADNVVKKELNKELSCRVEAFDFPVGGRTVSSPQWDFMASKMFVLVGQSGSGKTSFLTQLVGLGSCSFAAGHESRFAYVAQRPFLFDGTIGENLEYGLVAGIEGDLENGLGNEQQSFCRKRFNALPFRPTWLKWERSVEGLSGGQRYIVSFLRGMFFQRPVLVLDEPFASLDPDLEKWVFSLLESEIASGRAIVLSTHRFEVLREDHAIWEVTTKNIRPISLAQLHERYHPC